MKNIRIDLIEEELNKFNVQNISFRHLKLSNRYIDKLFNNYYITEHTEHFYDSEPKYVKEDFDLYFKLITHKETLKSRKIPEPLLFPIERYYTAYNKIKQQQKDYENERLRLNNWIEIYSEGVWNQTQKSVDKIAKIHLKNIKHSNISYKDRLYIAECDDEIYIYYYGRDYTTVDYWWFFKKKPHKK